MKQWLSNRIDFIDGQLVASPKLALPGTLTGSKAMLTLAAPTNVTVYYTLDGTDPRRPQGEIASNAVAYTGPVQIEAGAPLLARARNPKQIQSGGPPTSTPWSGMLKTNIEVTSRESKTAIR